MNLEFLLTGPEAKLEASSLVRTVAISNADGLNIRAQASMDSEVVTQISKGAELEFLEDQGEWIKVSIDGEEAFAAAEYVTVEEKLDTAITMTELLYGEGRVRCESGPGGICKAVSGQSLCLGRHQPDQWSGLFRICIKRIQEIWHYSEPFLKSPGK